jgi:hypothetical protein
MTPKRESVNFRTVRAWAAWKGDHAASWIPRAAKQEARGNTELSTLCDENVYRLAREAAGHALWILANEN